MGIPEGLASLKAFTGRTRAGIEPTLSDVASVIVTPYAPGTSITL
jgi:hypothetical protein